jgi:hypothetical protein
MVIDLNGTSASIIDIRRPPDPPSGQHWIDEPQRLEVTAGEVGQVFGVAIDDDENPDIFLSATAAFGLHRAPNGDWMPGMWGPDAGPGTVYRLSADTGFSAEKFADVTLEGRPNSGAALGNIAYDPWHKQVFVSDLETGMIHRLDRDSGQDLGHYDHGTSGRKGFVDAWTGQQQSLPPIGFDPSSSAKMEACSGNFSRTPECWNIADFRRRIWGLGASKGANGEVRLYYSVWGSDALGNPDWPNAGDDRRNAVWSVGLKQNGDFDLTGIRREFFLPAFWPSGLEQGDKAGNSNPVSDITFPTCGPQNVMIVAERGGMRNLGLTQADAFARPHESRVLRYKLAADGIWRPEARYEVGFYGGHTNSAGGAAFGYGFDDAGQIDTSKPDQSLWMTGDSLCSPDGPCTSMDTGEYEDRSDVNGLQGSPAEGFGPVEQQAAQAELAASKPADFGVLDRSYMIDADINVDASGNPIPETLTSRDATRVGDVAIYEICKAAPALPVISPPQEDGGEVVDTGEDFGGAPPPVGPPEWPVHTLAMSHDKWASSGHNVNRSWHQRNASFHSVERSWHWKGQSWHSVNRSWHWREGSWHDARRSWHWKSQSWHTRDRTWHWKQGSWHDTAKSWHRKNASFHEKIYSWHQKPKSWHLRDRSFHDRARSWDNDHVKGRSWHQKGQSWAGQHVKGRSWHVKGQTWGGEEPRHVKGKSFHNKGQTWGGGGPEHSKRESRQKQGGGEPEHSKRESRQKRGGGEPEHSKRESRQKQGDGDQGGRQPEHSKRESRQKQGGGDQGGGQSEHSKRESRQKQGGGDQGGGQPELSKRGIRQKQCGGYQGGGTPEHSKRESRQKQGGGDQGGSQPEHNKRLSRQQTGGGDQGGGQPVHNRNLSRQQSGGGNLGDGSGQPVHNKMMSRQQSQQNSPQTGQGSNGQSPPIFLRKRKMQEQEIPQ